MIAFTAATLLLSELVPPMRMSSPVPVPKALVALIVSTLREDRFIERDGDLVHDNPNRQVSIAMFCGQIE